MGKLYVVGFGSGNYEDLTIKADKVLQLSDFIYCDERAFEQFKQYYQEEKLISNKYTATSERCDNAIKSAIINDNVSVLGSGDTGIYGISSIVIKKVMELAPELDLEIIPGITSAFSGAALLGSPLAQDFAVITLSDSLADSNMESRIINSAKSDFCIVFYSPYNSTVDNLKLAKNILLSYRSPETVVGLVSDIGCTMQNIDITTLSDLNTQNINPNTTIFVGRSDTQLTKTKRIITPLY